MSPLLTCPQVELKIFLECKARARNFLCFRWQSERETGSWDYYRNRKREAKDFEKVYILPGLLPFSRMRLAHFDELRSYWNPDASKETTSGLKKRKKQ